MVTAFNRMIAGVETRQGFSPPSPMSVSLSARLVSCRGCGDTDEPREGVDHVGMSFGLAVGTPRTEGPVQRGNVIHSHREVHQSDCKIGPTQTRSMCTHDRK